MENEIKKKYVSIVLDRDKDKSIIEDIGLISKFGNIKLKDILLSGLKSYKNSDFMKEKLSKLNKLINKQ